MWGEVSLRNQAAGFRLGGNTGEDEWPGGHALAALYECNERLLDLLQAHVRKTHREDPFVQDIRPLLERVDTDSKARAARCAVLLADPGFDDAKRWTRALTGSPPEHEYVASPYFTLSETIDMARQMARVILTCAAHLAYSDAGAARLLFGLAPECIDAFAAHTVTQVAQLGDSHWIWFRPRWINKPGYWRELLTTAMNGTPATQARVRVRGLQLLAGEARLS